MRPANVMTSFSVIAVLWVCASAARRDFEKHAGVKQDGEGAKREDEGEARKPPVVTVDESDDWNDEEASSSQDFDGFGDSMDAGPAGPGGPGGKGNEDEASALSGDGFERDDLQFEDEDVPDRVEAGSTEDVSPATPLSDSRCCVCGPPVSKIKWSKSGSCSLCRNKIVSMFNPPEKCANPKGASWTDDEQRACHPVCRKLTPPEDKVKAKIDPLDEQESQAMQSATIDEDAGLDNFDFEDEVEPASTGGGSRSGSKRSGSSGRGGLSGNGQSASGGHSQRSVSSSGPSPQCCVCGNGTIKWSKSGSCSLCRGEIARKFDPPPGSCSEGAFTGPEQKACHKTCRNTAEDGAMGDASSDKDLEDDSATIDEDELDFEDHEDQDGFQEEKSKPSDRSGGGSGGGSQSSGGSQSGGGPRCCDCADGEVKWSNSGSCSLCKGEFSTFDPPMTCSKKETRSRDAQLVCHGECKEKKQSAGVVDAGSLTDDQLDDEDLGQNDEGASVSRPGRGSGKVSGSQKGPVEDDLGSATLDEDDFGDNVDFEDEVDASTPVSGNSDSAEDNIQPGDDRKKCCRCKTDEGQGTVIKWSLSGACSLCSKSDRGGKYDWFTAPSDEECNKKVPDGLDAWPAEKQIKCHKVCQAKYGVLM